MAPSPALSTALPTTDETNVLLIPAAPWGGTDFTGVLRVFDELFKQGNAEGITFVASSGDLGGVPVPPLEYFTTPPKKTPAITGHFLPGVEFFAS